MNRILLCIGLFLSVHVLSAQNLLKGSITDSESNDPLIGCTILLKGTATGAITDWEGNFSIDIPSLPDTIVVSYVGYMTQEIVVESVAEPLEIQMEFSSITIDEEIVVSASRIGESLKESPRSIQKLNSKQISLATSGDFYQDIGTLKEIDVTSSSLGFRVINTRGFNSTAPVRMVQFIDGVDNQAPGLNFPVGNLVGIPEIDLQGVEVISGASSTLYGANAFQGVVSMISKSPYDYPGLQVKLKGGSRALFDGQVRYATTLGKSDRVGIKITGGYFRAEDWVADDEEANLYGDIDPDVNVSQIVRELQFDEDVELAADFRALNAWLDFYPVALPGTVNVQAPGYMEADLSDNITESAKLGAELHYKFGEDGGIQGQYRFGRGTAVYQGSNRYSINNILFHQLKAQLDYKGFQFKYFSTMENGGDSYDIVFTGINLSVEGVENYVEEWIGAYFDTLSYYTNEFGDEPRQDEVTISRSVADSIANALAWLKPGSPEFQAAFDRITSDPDLNTGSRFQDKSSLHHVEAQYQYDQLDKFDLIVGTAYRLYRPQSYGTIFRDTLINSADTLFNGEVNKDAEFVNLNTHDISGYFQGIVSLVDDRLKITGSLRVDKSENYDVQFSPGLSTVFSWKKNTVRLSGQTAFRSPTLQNQYILLDLGVIALKGNLNGITNSYTQESVEAFEDKYAETLEIDPTILTTYTSGPIKPEQVYSIEAGYRGVWGGDLYVDINGYVNWYKDFIGDIRVVEPQGDANVFEESGVNAILTEYYDLIQYPTNARETVLTYGASIGLNYYVWKSLKASANYTFTDINTKNLTDPIVPGYNTPMHKFNVGLSGTNLYKGLGFGLQCKWMHDFLWESPFGDGQVPSYYTIDAQVNYQFDKFITIQVGGSNITNNRHRQAYGSPIIGGTVYASVLFDLNRN